MAACQQQQQQQQQQKQLSAFFLWNNVHNADNTNCSASQQKALDAAKKATKGLLL